ncbi:MAG TPA: YdcF family protein [Candidatus Acidoferrales bacterium]|nr:YdcF family protein [Candidatus Acidoferrales bacterium]
MNSLRRQRGSVLFRFIGLLFVVALVLVVALARVPLMKAAGNWLVVSDPPARADAIIVLSGDDYQADRAARAAQLYRQGWVPLVVASGSQIRPYLSEADLTERDLAADGVPAAAILRFPQSDLYTLGEARDLRKLCIEKNWRRVLVVTSNYHTRRARYIFHRVFPSDLYPLVIAAPDSHFIPDAWWLSRLGTKIFLHETFGLVVAFWELHAEHSG